VSLYPGLVPALLEMRPREAYPKNMMWRLSPMLANWFPIGSFGIN
jgi:hypothetical protein